MAEKTTADLELPAARLRLLATEPRLSGLRAQLLSLADALDAEHEPPASDADHAGHGRGIERWAGTNIFSAFLQDDAIGPAVGARKWLGPLLDIATQILFFVPIIVTWLGLMLATLAYQQVVQLKSFAGKSFLQGWQSGFGGRLPGFFSLNHVALFIVIVITVLILFILIQYFYSANPVEAERARLYRELTSALTATDLHLAPLRVSAPTEAATALHRATTEFARTADSIREVGVTAGKVQREAVAGLTALTSAMAKTAELSSTMESAADNITGTSKMLEKRLGEVGTTTSAIAAAQVELVRQISLSSDRLSTGMDAMVKRFQEAVSLKEAGITSLAADSASKINAALMAGAEQLRSAITESTGSLGHSPATLEKIDVTMAELRDIVSQLNNSVAQLARTIGTPKLAGDGPDRSISAADAVPGEMRGGPADIRAASADLRTAADSLVRASPRDGDERLTGLVSTGRLEGLIQRLWRIRRVWLISGLAAVAILAVIPLLLLTGSQPQTLTRSYVFSPQSNANGLRVQRTWTLSGPGGSALRTVLTIRNTSGNQVHAVYLEPILKTEAAYLHSIEFAPPPFRVIASPSFAEWNVALAAHKTQTIRYTGRVPALGVSAARLDSWASAFASQEERLTNRLATLRGLAISPASVALTARQKSQLRLSGQLSDGSPAPDAMLSGVSWRSDNEAVATVSATGAVVGAGKGTAHITAQIGTVTASAIVRVS